MSLSNLKFSAVAPAMVAGTATRQRRARFIECHFAIKGGVDQ